MKASNEEFDPGLFTAPTQRHDCDARGCMRGSTRHVQQGLEGSGHPRLAVEDKDDISIEVQHNMAEPVDLFALLKSVCHGNKQKVLLLGSLLD